MKTSAILPCIHGGLHDIYRLMYYRHRRLFELKLCDDVHYGRGLIASQRNG